MRFVPMHLRTAKGTIEDTNHGHPLHFPPVTTPVHAVEVASGMHATSRSDGCNGSDLSNDLKVHDVSASSSSGLQRYGPYAPIIIPHVSMTEAERPRSAAGAELPPTGACTHKPRRTSVPPVRCSALLGAARLRPCHPSGATLPPQGAQSTDLPHYACCPHGIRRPGSEPCSWAAFSGKTFSVHRTA